MSGDQHRRVASGLLAPGSDASSDDGEQLLGASPAWVARVGPKGHVLFVGRHRHLVALTDRRLVAWRHPKRAGARPALDVPLSALRLRGEHTARPFFQVLASDAPDDAGDAAVARGGRERRGTLVIELRHRDHAFARALGRAIGATTAASTA